MGTKERYRGYVVEADPVRRRGRWAARAVFEIHEHGGVNFQEVPGDPFETYETREQASQASMTLGKAILDTRPPHQPALAPHPEPDKAA
jgi:hypothetical protein